MPFNTTVVDKNGTVTLAKILDSSTDLLPQVIVESPSEHNDKVHNICHRPRWLPLIKYVTSSRNDITMDLVMPNPDDSLFEPGISRLPV